MLAAVTSWFIAGGAGFIGSHLVRRLLEDEGNESVVVYDNFCSGKRWHLAELEDSKRLRVIEADIENSEMLLESMTGSERVISLAANADIAAAVTQPGIDFWTGTFLIHQVLEAARQVGIERFTYTSGSGVYGDQGLTEVDETLGPLFPVSTYGASKLAGEALVSAYCHLFGMQGVAFRFANVVGARQTHGVVYDFVRKIQADSTKLEVMGDGSQSKSYIHVSDVVDAVMLLAERPPEVFDVYNVGTDEYVTVREIAAMTASYLGHPNLELRFGPEPRGWKGDVPVVRFSSEKIRALGWSNKYTTKAALEDSIAQILSDTSRGA